MNRARVLSFEVSNRLFVAAVGLWLALAALEAGGLIAFYRADQAYSRSLEQVGEVQAAAARLQAGIISEVLNTRAFLIAGEDSAATRRDLAHQDTLAEQERLTQLLAASPNLAAPSFEKMVALHTEYDGVADQLFLLGEQGKTSQALALFDAQSDPLVAAVQQTSQDLNDEIRAGMMQASQEYSQGAETAILVVGGLFLAFTAAGGLIIFRRVTPPLRQLDYFERAVIDSGETQVFHPIEATAPGEDPPPLFSAYNRLARRLVDSNASLLRYLSRLNHEVNTLLASILGYGYLVADANLRPDDANLQEYGGIIVSQTRRVTRLVENFSLAAKIEGNNYTPPLIPLRLGPLLAALTDDVCAETQRTVTLTGAQDGGMLLADALSLEKALRELIENALNFSAPDQPVAVEMERSPSRRVMLVRVRDAGIGIAPEDIERVFKPFGRINNEVTRRAQGSGLGLYIASAILRLHHGSITVQSQPGVGSTFTVTLPLEDG